MTTPRRPPRVTLVIAAVAALTGAVWIAQGLGVPIGGSFMVGDPFWSVAGAVLVATAGGVIWQALRRT